MGDHLFTIESFKNTLRKIHKGVTMNLVQCGMDMSVIEDNGSGQKTIKIHADDKTPMRRFFDCVAVEGMHMQVSVTIPTDERETPQLIFNAMMMIDEISKNLLDTFFTMCRRTMESVPEKWEEARSIDPLALAALENVLRSGGKPKKPSIDSMVEDLAGLNSEDMLHAAIERLRGSIAILKDPPKSTN